MSYLFLVQSLVDRTMLASTLADVLAVSVDAVDVGMDGEEDRNWERAVSCTVTSLTGDLRMHLDIYCTDGVATPPKAEAAARLASLLNTLVAYSSVPLPPSAYWLVGPDGRTTRARIIDTPEDDTGRSTNRIAAVESPLPLLPGVAVLPQPEVIHEYPMPIPLADDLHARHESLATGGLARDAINQLAAWESMVNRLAAGWPPDGWYPPEYYRDGLEIRDNLVAAAGELPETIRSEFTEALDAVDRRFAEKTRDDAGEALTSITTPVPDRWWWHRITDPLPWDRMPGNNS